MSRNKQVVISKKIVVLILIIIILALVLICRSIIKRNNNNNSVNSMYEIDFSQFEDYELPIAYFYNGIQKKDFNIFLKAYPDFMQIDSQYSVDNLQGFYDQVSDECGDNIILSFEIGEPLICSELTINNLEESFSTSYGADVQIDKAYEIEVHLTYTGSNGTVEQTITHTVFYYNNTWYTV